MVPVSETEPPTDTEPAGAVIVRVAGVVVRATLVWVVTVPAGAVVVTAAGAPVSATTV
jgi:hypothetical protein